MVKVAAHFGGHPLEPHIVEFLTDLAVAESASGTIEGYAHDLRAFCREHSGGLGEITTEGLRAHLAGMSGGASTRQRRRAALAAFLKWCVAQEVPALEIDPMGKVAAVRVPQRLPRPARTGLVPKLLDTIAPAVADPDTPLDRLRDRILFELLYVAAARASEGLRVDLDDLDLRPGDEHVILHGKGGKMRSVLIAEPRFVALLHYYIDRCGYLSGPLLRPSVHGNGSHLSYNAAYDRWQIWTRAAGVKLTIHQLRHTRATELLRAGMPIAALSAMLGHSSLDTTQLYARYSPDAVDQAVRAALGIG